MHGTKPWKRLMILILIPTHGTNTKLSSVKNKSKNSHRHTPLLQETTEPPKDRSLLFLFSLLQLSKAKKR
jgi:hypothetical protein